MRPYKTEEACEFFDVELAHATLVDRLAKPGEHIVTSMNPEKAHLLHMIVGIAGEAGELVDAVKKHVFYNKELDVENVVEELGDLLFYMEGVAQAIDITLISCKYSNIAKLERRYGSTYSDEAAKQRKDKCE